MTVAYRHTPLIEAVFEFVPERTTRWDDAAPGQITQSLTTSYSGKPDEFQNLLATVELSSAGAKTRQERGSTRYRLWNPDRTRMAQFGSDMCAFNALAPYTHYEDYVPAMEDLVEEYAGRTRPTGVGFLGQRYINRIWLPSEEAEPSDYFTGFPRFSKSNARHPPFSLQVQVETIVQGTTVLSLNFQGLDDGIRPTYLLQVYARTPNSPPIPFEWEGMKAWQDQAHASVKRAFEDAITDRCRELLGREEER